jgi:quercetin dioxygenase-like cupin family protein
MAEAQVFSNPETGQEIRVLTADDEALVLESLMPPNSPQPPPHYHPAQHESFEVLEGEVATLIGGEERTYSQGERFEVPAGTVHEMSNKGEAPARLHWETRPALRTLQFFEVVGKVWQGDHEAGAELMNFTDTIRFDVENA